MSSLPILIDEVQYAPQLFSYIKIAIDEGAIREVSGLQDLRPLR